MVKEHLRRLKGGGSTIVRDFTRKNKKRDNYENYKNLCLIRGDV